LIFGRHNDNYNRMDLLDKCLKSIKRYLQTPDYEVIIIDNASTDKTELLIESKYSNFIYIKNQENCFFAKANNQGNLIAKGKSLFFC